jgi:hypothetical protein
MTTSDFYLLPIGGIVTEMKFPISSEFISCRICVCERACNKVAHALATIGCSLPSAHALATTWDHVPREFEGLDCL